MKTIRILRAKCVNVQLNGTPDLSEKTNLLSEMKQQRVIRCQSSSLVIQPSLVYILLPFSPALLFQIATNGLYKMVCPSARLSVQPFVHSSVPLSVPRQRVFDVLYSFLSHLDEERIFRIESDIYLISKEELVSDPRRSVESTRPNSFMRKVKKKSGRGKTFEMTFLFSGEGKQVKTLY